MTLCNIFDVNKEEILIKHLAGSNQGIAKGLQFFLPAIFPTWVTPKQGGRNENKIEGSACSNYDVTVTEQVSHNIEGGRTPPLLLPP